MDLLDDFDRVRATFSELGAIGQRIDSTLADEGGASSSLNVASTSYDLPGLSVEATVRQAARYTCSCWQVLATQENDTARLGRLDPSVFMSLHF